MKQFLLFAGYRFEPCGGWDDYEGDFLTMDEAISEATSPTKQMQYEWWHVVDMHSGKVVKRGE